MKYSAPSLLALRKINKSFTTVRKFLFSFIHHQLWHRKSHHKICQVYTWLAVQFPLHSLLHSHRDPLCCTPSNRNRHLATRNKINGTFMLASMAFDHHTIASSSWQGSSHCSSFLFVRCENGGASDPKNSHSSSWWASNYSKNRGPVLGWNKVQSVSHCKCKMWSLWHHWQAFCWWMLF